MERGRRARVRGAPAAGGRCATARIFTDEAMAALAARSGGVPRRVNTLATQALFVGAMRRLDAIDGELVGDVADDQE